ncbi:fatty acid cis/trans isomerase family protein, partial [Vibrio parahaemolyticus VPTS-2010]
GANQSIRNTAQPFRPQEPVDVALHIRALVPVAPVLL